jgi:hypothetical protein
MISMAPLRASALRCSSAALADRKPSSRAMSARVGGRPVELMWAADDGENLFLARGKLEHQAPVNSYSACDYIQCVVPGKP